VSDNHINSDQMATTSATPKGKAKQSSMETRSRLEQCWERDVNRNLYPSLLAKVQ